MIEKLDIVNFQSHKDSSLEFVPGVNVIVGDSDSGKTAVIRALRWLVWNKPGGEAFRSTWGGDTKVSLTTSEEYKVTREKGRGNMYTARDEHMGGETETFKAFGANVPEPIQKILNLDETNLQLQLDSPFLISSSPGEVSAFFNKIANLDQIDSGIRNVQANIRSITNEIQADERRVGELEEDSEKYEYLAWAEVELEVLEDSHARLVQSVQRKNRLSKLISDLETVEEQIEESAQILKYEPAVDVLLAKYEEKNDNTLAAMRLFKTIGEVETIYSNLRDLKETILPKLEKEFDELMPDICPLCETKLKK